MIAVVSVRTSELRGKGKGDRESSDVCSPMLLRAKVNGVGPESGFDFGQHAASLVPTGYMKRRLR
jgi:hypothetical protein